MRVPPLARCVRSYHLVLRWYGTRLNPYYVMIAGKQPIVSTGPRCAMAPLTAASRARAAPHRQIRILGRHVISW